LFVVIISVCVYIYLLMYECLVLVLKLLIMLAFVINFLTLFRAPHSIQSFCLLNNHFV